MTASTVDGIRAVEPGRAAAARDDKEACGVVRFFAVIAKGRIRELDREHLEEFIASTLPTITEDEVLAALDNPMITPRICQAIAQNQRVTAFYAVRLRLVAHRQTPQAHAVKFVHYLYWPDLIRLSVDVTVQATVRRAIDTALLARVEKMTLGERISSARRCSSALIKAFLFDPDPHVFEALLVNSRLREDDLLLLATSSRATREKLVLLADDPRWSFRYAIRKALVMNPQTPRSVAASQLRFLQRRDLTDIHHNPATSTYLKRCIERLRPDDFSARADRIE